MHARIRCLFCLLESINPIMQSIRQIEHSILNTETNYSNYKILNIYLLLIHTNKH